MQKIIEEFKKYVIKQSSKPSFIHHKWFVEYHLDIVEKIALELCEIHEEADKDLVLILVWLHDYGKIVDFGNQYEASVINGREQMTSLGFEEEIIDKAISYVEMIDRKIETELKEAPIEVKIVSSADGAAHLVGPFFPIWLYENPNTDLRELMEGSVKKALKDWNKKIVLPEVLESFKDRHQFIMEQQGILPERFIKK